MVDPRKSWKDYIRTSLEFVVLSGAVLLASCKDYVSSGGNSPHPENPESPEDPRPVPGVVYYVDDDGDDNNPGTKSKPWKSIERQVNKKLKPGDKVFIRKGEYEESIAPQTNGTDEKPIVYEAFPGEKPIIRGSKNRKAAVDLANRSYIEVRGIHIKNPHKRYVDGEGASFTILEDIVMTGLKIDQHGVTFGTYGTPATVQTHHNQLIGCAIQGHQKNHPDSRLAFENVSFFGGDGVHNNIIADCEIDGADHVALNFKGIGAPNKPVGPHHNVVTRSIIRNPLHHSVAIAYGARNILLEYSNIDQSGDGINAADDGEGIHLAPLRSIFRFVTITESGSEDIEHRLEAGIGMAWNALRGKKYFSGDNIFYHCNLEKNRGPGLGISVGIAGTDCQVYPQSLIKGSQFINSVIANNARTLKGDFKLAEIVYLFYQSRDCVEMKGKKEMLPPQDIYRHNIIGTSPYQRVFLMKWPHLQGSYTIEQAEHSLPFTFNNNFSGNAIEGKERGDFLTTTVTEGHSTFTIRVRDARAFIGPPNWPIADTIQIGKQRVTIESIDYKDNIIYGESRVNYEKGDGVHLPFQGERPSIGNYEE